MPSPESYLGSIGIAGFNNPPMNFAIADGSTIPISQNSALYSIFNTIYGGNGSSNFQLPDLQSRLPIGTGTGAGLSSYEIGETTGRESTSLLNTNLPPHTHQVSLGGTGGAGGWATAGGSTATPDGTSAAVIPAGDGMPFSILPPVLALTYLVALNGPYPVRY